MKVTINDVARLAGVSKGTVSKFLNDTPYVSEANKAVIAAAIEKLGYEPNRLAQGLSLGRSKTVGLVVANIGNPFYGELIRGAEVVAAQCGYTLLLASTDGNPKRESGIVGAMRQQQVDGIVFASVRLEDVEVSALAKDGVKVVLASRHLPTASVDTVRVDGVLGGRMAVEHLIGHGHKRIAYVGGPQSIAQFQERAQGWRDALEHAGLSTHSELSVHVDQLDIDAGVSAMRRLLALADPPTAVFAATDNLAFGVLKACNLAGVAVPKQLALIGFDNVAFGEVALVPLTSVDGSGFGIGQRAMRLMIDGIERAPDAAEQEPTQIVMEPTLCIRRSCGCSPKQEPL
jgi:DNA-binding LacI/PurR family transcriptional regulator